MKFQYSSVLLWMFELKKTKLNLVLEFQLCYVNIKIVWLLVTLILKLGSKCYYVVLLHAKTCPKSCGFNVFFLICGSWFVNNRVYIWYFKDCIEVYGIYTDSWQKFNIYMHIFSLESIYSYKVNVINFSISK